MIFFERIDSKTKDIFLMNKNISFKYATILIYFEQKISLV